MEAAVGLLVVLVGASHGVETHCDGRQDGAQCYGALGGTVFLQLMDNASEMSRYQWRKETTVILTGQKDRHRITIQNRSVFNPSNGTLTINNLRRTDSGEYTLETFDSNGIKLPERTLHLSIEAPVSSVLVTPHCLSQGEKRMSCSSVGGDSPQYRWTLDGRTPTDAELVSGNHEDNTITLKVHVSGRLVCSVRNHISNASREETLPTCGFKFINCTLFDGTHISQWVFEANNTLCIDPTTAPTTTVGKETGIGSITPSTNITSFNQTVPPPIDEQWYIKTLPIMAGVLTALVIFLAVAVAVICAQKKKQRNKCKAEDDGEELTYADVRVLQRQGRPVEHSAEVQVEYGEVTFSERPRQTEATGNDCVYAKVRHGR